MVSELEIATAAPRVEAFLANTDPTAQQSDMHAIAQLFAQSHDAEKLSELTRTALSHLSADDRQDLFNEFSEILQSDQLLGVFLGFDAESHLTDRTTLRVAIASRAPEQVREEFVQAVSIAERKLLLTPAAPPNQTRERQVYDLMQAARKAAPKANPNEGTRIVLDAAKLITRPYFNEFHRTHGNGNVERTDAESLKSAVNKGLAFAENEAHAAQFGTAESNPQRIVKNLLSAVGDSKKAHVSLVPMAYADKEAGCTYTMLFRVDNPANDTHFVDSLGRTYASIEDFRLTSTIAPDHVNLVVPKDGRIALNAQGDVKLFTGDARIEDQNTKWQREHHIQEAIAVGWTAVGVGSMFLTGGLSMVAMGAAGAVSAGSTASDIKEQKKRGEDWTPWDSRQTFFQWAGMGLAAYGSTQTGVRLASSVAGEMAQTGSKVAQALEAASNALHSRAPTLITAIGDSVSALNGMYDFATQLPNMTGLQIAHKTLETAMQIVGLKYNVAQIRCGGRPPPLQAASPAKRNEFNPFIAPVDGATPSSVATAANIRDAVWHRGNHVPDDIRQAYAELHAHTENAEPAVELNHRAQQVFAVRERQPDGSQKIVGVSVVELQGYGDRTMDIPGTNVHISLDRYLDGSRVRKGDAKLVSVVGESSGLTAATRAALVGMKSYTQQRRVIVNTTDPAVLAGAQAVKGSKVVLSRVTANAQEAVNEAISQGRVVQQRVRDAAQLPDRQAALAALATADNLPAGARIHQIVHTIDRPLEGVLRKVLYAARPGSLIYKLNDLVNPIRHGTNLAKYLANPVKSVKEIASWQVRTGESSVHTLVSKIYPRNKLPDRIATRMALTMELADRESAKLTGLTEQQIRQRQGAFKKDFLQSKGNAVVVIQRDGTKDGKMIGGGVVTARYYGDKKSGTFAGEAIPDDAVHISHMFTAPGYESAYVDVYHAGRTAAGRYFKGSEVNTSTSNVQIRTALAASNTPFIRAEYTAEAAPILAVKRREHLPTPIRDLLERIDDLPEAKRLEALQDALHVNNNRDFLLPWLEARKLYLDLIVQDANTGWHPDAATRIMDALASNPAAVDRLPHGIRDAVLRLDTASPYAAAQLQNALEQLPPPIRHPRAEAQAAKRSILDQGFTPENEERAEAAFRAVADRIDQETTPMLELPDRVVQMHYRDPLDLDLTLYQRFKETGWQVFRNSPPVRLFLETMGHFTGRPRYKTEIDLIDAQLNDNFIAELNPRHTLTRKEYGDGAKALKEANSGHANNVFAQKTVQQLTDELQNMYVVRLYRKQADGTRGELLNTSSLAVNYKGPQGDNVWEGVDGMLPPNSVEHTHLFGRSHLPEVDRAAYTAAMNGARDQLLANHMVYDTRRKEAQAFFERLGIAPRHVAPSSHASDLLLGVGPLEMKTLPPRYQHAIQAARMRSPLVSQQREFLDEFLQRQGTRLFADSKLLPDGMIDMAFITDLTPTMTPGQSRAQAAGVFMSQTVKPMLRAAGRGIGIGWHAVIPYSGDKSIEPSVGRKFAQDVGYLGLNSLSYGWHAAKWGLVAAAAYKLLHKDDVQTRTNSDQAMKTFNVAEKSKSWAGHMKVASLPFVVPLTGTKFSNLGVTVAVWHSPMSSRPPMFPKEWGGPRQPSQPMLKFGTSLTNLLATGLSATPQWLGRWNLGDFGLGINIGNNDVGERFAVGMRLASFAYNLRADIPLAPNAGKGIGFLTAFTPFQAYCGVTTNMGPIGLIARINAMTVALIGQVGQLAHAAEDAGLALFAGRRLQVSGKKPGVSEGDFVTINMAHGVPQVWYEDENLPAKKVDAQPVAKPQDTASVADKPADVAPVQPVQPAQPTQTVTQPAKAAPLIEHTVSSGDSVWRVAKRMQPEGMTVQETIAALYRANPKAFKNNNINELKQGATLVLPPKGELQPLDSGDVRRLIQKSVLDFARSHPPQNDNAQQKPSEPEYHDTSPYSRYEAEGKFGAPQFHRWTILPIAR